MLDARTSVLILAAAAIRYQYRISIPSSGDLIVELRQLRSFVAVARAGSFTRAARALRVAQPALSQHIRALEDETGVVLVQRTNRTSGLTEAGQALLARAERILAEVHDAGEELAAHAGLARGTVRIGCAVQTVLEGALPRLLAEFTSRHPGVAIAFREVHTEKVLELLGRGEIDLGLIHLARAGSGAGDIAVGAQRAGGEIVLARLYREPLVVIAGRRHRLAARAAIALEDLRDEPFVAFGPGATVRALVEAAAERRGFAPRVAFTTTNLATVRAFVSAGLGVAVVPASALAVPGPPLHAIRVAGLRLERTVTLARNSARYEGPAVAAMRRLLSDGLRRPRG